MDTNQWILDNNSYIMAVLNGNVNGNYIHVLLIATLELCIQHHTQLKKYYHNNIKVKQVAYIYL